jgi:gliding motility-associated-like protein
MKKIFFILAVIISVSVKGQGLPGSGNSAGGFDPSYINIPNFPVTSFPMSVTFWFKRNNLGGVQAIFSSDNTLGGYHGMWIQTRFTNVLDISYATPGGCYTPFCRRGWDVNIPSNIYPMNEWMHVAVVIHNLQNADIYFNGVLQPKTPTGSGSLSLVASANPVARIGTYQHAAGGSQFNTFKSEVDELSIWSTALTAAQVREFMCKKIPPLTPGLLAYYKFDEPNATVPVQDASTPAYNGTTMGGPMTRPLSGAFIGDESGYTYNPGGGLIWTNSFGESFDVVNPSANVQGMHVYTVEDNPNHFNGIGADSICTLGRYHGVFFVKNSTANSTASFSITGSGLYGGAYRRSANDAPLWNAVTTGLSIGDTMSFPLVNSQEIITVSGSDYNSGLPDTILQCDFPYTIQANPYPTGTITWQHGGTGNTTQVQGPGWYFLQATSNCAALTFTDSVYIMDDIIPFDTLVLLCPGQTFNFAGQTFQDTGTYIFQNNNPQGCDTLYEVVIGPSSDNILIDTLARICKGESFVIGGNTFTTSGQFQFTIFSQDGCDSVINLTVEVLEDSVLAIQPFDEVICIGQPHTIRVFPMNSGLLSWSNGQTGESITITEGGFYSVIFQGQCGVQYDTIFIEDRECKPILFIPSAFTPNGDGRNERFVISGSGIRSFEMRVFNRWGQQIFYSTDLNFSWDGTFNGKLVQMSSYVYIITYTGFDSNRTYEERGTVNVIR